MDAYNRSVKFTLSVQSAIRKAIRDGLREFESHRAAAMAISTDALEYELNQRRIAQSRITGLTEANED